MTERHETAESALREVEVRKVLRSRPKYSMDASGRLYVPPGSGVGGGVLRGGWTFKSALREYLRSNKTHRWSANGKCTRCRVELSGHFAKLECAHPSTKAVDPSKEIVACPLVDVLGRYLDMAICRARFAKKRGVWPAAGEALLEWDKHMPDDPIE